MKSSRLMTLAMVGCAVAAMAACTRRPVEGAVPGPETQQPTGPAYPTAPTGPVTGGQVGSAIPGSEQDFVVNVGDRIYFDLDSYDVRPEAMPRLDAQAQWLQRYPSVTVRIEGNADERGTREYNLALGEQRANSVKNYLVALGVDSNRIRTVSYGKEQPVDPRSTEAAWSKNRRGVSMPDSATISQTN